jgi:hypothetical protein
MRANATRKERPMGLDDRPTVLGIAELKKMDPEKAIERLEHDLKQQAESLRKIRFDYIRGVITESEFEKVEATFQAMLLEQRQALQNLRRAAMEKK